MSKLDKDAFYFPHFSQARNDLKIRRLRKQLGIEGYGIFFMILEVLRDETEHTYPLKDIDLLADEFGTSEQKVEAVIRNYELFQFDSEYFWSDKFIQFLEPYYKRKSKALKAAKARWQPSSNANAMLEHNTSKPQAMQSKVKESKVNKSKVSNEASASEIAERQKLDEQFEKGWKVYCNFNGSIKPRGSKKKAKEYFNKMDTTEKRKALNAMKYIAMETEHQYRIHLSRLLAPTEKRYRDYQHLSMNDIQVQRKINDPHPTDDRLMWSGQKWILKEEEWN